MPERDYSRIATINCRVHREVLGLVAHLLEDSEGILRNEEGTTSIDVSFMSLLLDLEYDGGEEACTVGATYKQIYRIGYQVGFGKR